MEYEARRTPRLANIRPCVLQTCMADTLFMTDDRFTFLREALGAPPFSPVGIDALVTLFSSPRGKHALKVVVARVFGVPLVGDYKRRCKRQSATPLRGCQFVVALGLPFVSYRKAIAHTKNVVGVSVPRLLASRRSMRDMWGTLVAQMRLQPTLHYEDATAVCWGVVECLTYMLQRSPFRELLPKDMEKLQIVARTDAFPLSDGHWTVVLLTLLNYGRHAATLPCNQLIALCDRKLDDDQSAMEVLFKPVLQELQDAATAGTVLINGVVYTCAVHLGADEPMLRTVMGLRGIKSAWRSVYTLSHRNDSTSRSTWRSMQQYASLGGSRLLGYDHKPVLLLRDMRQLLLCILHAYVSLGRQLLLLCYDQAVQNDTVLATAILLREAHVRVSFVRGPPKHGGFNLSGDACHALFNGIERIAAGAKISPAALASCCAMRAIFLVLHIVEFDTPEKITRRTAALRLLPSVCHEFQIHICRHHRPYYLEYVQDVFPLLLVYYHPLGLPIISNMVCETANCILKMIHAEYTNRGGGCSTPADLLLQVMGRYFMRTEVFATPMLGTSAHLPVEPWERRRLDL